MADDRDPDEEHRAVFGQEHLDECDGSGGCDCLFKLRVQHQEKYGFPLYELRAINQVKNNDPTFVGLRCFKSMSNLSDLAWEMLGRYIAANDHLRHVHLSDVRLTDAKMALLFKRWKKSTTLAELELRWNDFGSDGIRSITPLLKSAPNLTILALNGHKQSTFDSSSFELVIQALDGGPLEELSWSSGKIESIAALGQHSLPQLKKLRLASNPNIRNLSVLESYTQLEELDLSVSKIGVDGCRLIAKLLKNKNASLRTLNLNMNKIGDDEAVMLADSLKQNNVLKSLELDNNEKTFGEAGCLAFLRLVNDVASIERTAKSNHKLTWLQLPRLSNRKDTWQAREMKQLIEKAISVNESHEGKPHRVAREKIIKYQLITEKRENLCRLQGVDCNYDRFLEGLELDAVYAPNILAMTGEIWEMTNPNIDEWFYWDKVAFTEFYCMLKGVMAPALISLVGRRGMLEDEIERNRGQIAALAAEHARQTKEYAKHTERFSQQSTLFLRQTTAITAKNFALNKRLVSMGFGEKVPATAERGSDASVRDTKKRRRSASF